MFLLLLLLSCTATQARDKATIVEDRGTVLHEGAIDTCTLLPPTGPQQLKSFVQGLAALATEAATFPAGDCALVDATFSATQRPILTLRGGRTTGGQAWELPATAGLPDLRLRVATLPATFTLCAPGATPPQVNYDSWPERLDPNLDMAGLRTAITERVRDFILPVQGLQAAEVDAKYVGVRRVGAILQAQVAAGNYRADDLYADPDFWRGALEMAEGNPLVDAAPALAEIAGGRLEAAQGRLDLLHLSSEGSNAAGLHVMALWLVYQRLSALQNALIEEGIALEDAGEHAGAIARYDKVLAQTPCAAWAVYERGLSRRSMDLITTEDDLDAHTASLVACDPLYPRALGAAGDAQIQALLWRLELNAPTTKEGKLADRLIRYADAAMELGQPGIAGQYYLDAIRRGGGNRSAKDLVGDVALAATEAGATAFVNNIEGGPESLADARSRRSNRRPPAVPPH